MGKIISELVRPDQIQSWLAAAFSEVGIATLEALRDDQQVQRAALTAYERIPLFPVRVAIKATIGQDGFTAFVFRVRDEMIELNATDFSWLTANSLKSLCDLSGDNDGKHPLSDTRPSTEATVANPPGIGNIRNPWETPQGAAKLPAMVEPLVPSSLNERSSATPSQQQRNSSQCPSCRYENRTRAKFCRACGVALSGEWVVLQPTVSSASEGVGPRSQSGAFTKLDAPDTAIALTLPDGASLEDTASGPASIHHRGENAAPSPAPQTMLTPVPTSSSSLPPAPCVPSLDSGESIESLRVRESSPSQVHPSSKVVSSSAADRTAGDDSRDASTAYPSASSQVESVTDRTPTDLRAIPAPVAQVQFFTPPQRPRHTLIAVVVAGLVLIAGAGYFTTGGFSKIAAQQNGTSQTSVSQIENRLPVTAGMPDSSTPPETPASNNRLAEVDPQATPDSPATPTRSGKAVYASSCRSCHTSGSNGSPRLNDVEAWRPRLVRSHASLYASVLNGKGVMRSCRGDQLLRDDEVKRAVDFMITEARSASKTTVSTPPVAGTPSPQPAPTVEATSAPAAPVAPIEGPTAWLPAMRAELERCHQGNFFERVLCTEKVKWKYCAPGRWNTVPECTVAKPANASGNS